MNYFSLQQEFRSLGCTDEAQTMAAFQLYIELCEVRRKLNVKYYYSDELNLIYLTDNDANDTIDNIYLANTSSATIDLTATETIRKTLIQRHTHECRDPEKVNLILAIVDANTTIVYYKLTLGLISLNTLKNECLKQNRSDSDYNAQETSNVE